MKHRAIANVSLNENFTDLFFTHVVLYYVFI